MSIAQQSLQEELPEEHHLPGSASEQLLQTQRAHSPLPSPPKPIVAPHLSPKRQMEATLSHQAVRSELIQQKSQYLRTATTTTTLLRGMHKEEHLTGTFSMDPHLTQEAIQKAEAASMKAVLIRQNPNRAASGVPVVQTPEQLQLKAQKERQERITKAQMEQEFAKESLLARATLAAQSVITSPRLQQQQHLHGLTSISTIDTPDLQSEVVEPGSRAGSDKHDEIISSTLAGSYADKLQFLAEEQAQVAHARSQQRPPTRLSTMDGTFSTDPSTAVTPARADPPTQLGLTTSPTGVSGIAGAEGMTSVRHTAVPAPKSQSSLSASRSALSQAGATAVLSAPPAPIPLKYEQSGYVPVLAETSPESLALADYARTVTDKATKRLRAQPNTANIASTPSEQHQEQHQEQQEQQPAGVVQDAATQTAKAFAASFFNSISGGVGQGAAAHGLVSSSGVKNAKLQSLSFSDAMKNASAEETSTRIQAADSDALLLPELPPTLDVPPLAGDLDKLWATFHPAADLPGLIPTTKHVEMEEEFKRQIAHLEPERVEKLLKTYRSLLFATARARMNGGAARATLETTVKPLLRRIMPELKAADAFGRRNFDRAAPIPPVEFGLIPGPRHTSGGKVTFEKFLFKSMRWKTWTDVNPDPHAFFQTSAEIDVNRPGLSPDARIYPFVPIPGITTAAMAPNATRLAQDPLYPNTEPRLVLPRNVVTMFGDRRHDLLKVLQNTVGVDALTPWYLRGYVGLDSLEALFNWSAPKYAVQGQPAIPLVTYFPYIFRSGGVLGRKGIPRHVMIGYSHAHIPVVLASTSLSVRQSEALTWRGMQNGELTGSMRCPAASPLACNNALCPDHFPKDAAQTALAELVASADGAFGADGSVVQMPNTTGMSQQQIQQLQQAQLQQQQLHQQHALQTQIQKQQTAFYKLATESSATISSALSSWALAAAKAAAPNIGASVASFGTSTQAITATNVSGAHSSSQSAPVATSLAVAIAAASYAASARVHGYPANVPGTALQVARDAGSLCALAELDPALAPPLRTRDTHTGSDAEGVAELEALTKLRAAFGLSLTPRFLNSDQVKQQLAAAAASTSDQAVASQQVPGQPASSQQMPSRTSSVSDDPPLDIPPDPFDALLAAATAAQTANVMQSDPARSETPVQTASGPHSSRTSAQAQQKPDSNQQPAVNSAEAQAELAALIPPLGEPVEEFGWDQLLGDGKKLLLKLAPSQMLKLCASRDVLLPPVASAYVCAFRAAQAVFNHAVAWNNANDRQSGPAQSGRPEDSPPQRGSSAVPVPALPLNQGQPVNPSAATSLAAFAAAYNAAIAELTGVSNSLFNSATSAAEALVLSVAGEGEVFDIAPRVEFVPQSFAMKGDLAAQGSVTGDEQSDDPRKQEHAIPYMIEQTSVESRYLDAAGHPAHSFLSSAVISAPGVQPLGGDVSSSGQALDLSLYGLGAYLPESADARVTSDPIDARLGIVMDPLLRVILKRGAPDQISSNADEVEASSQGDEDGGAKFYNSRALATEIIVRYLKASKSKMGEFGEANEARLIALPTAEITDDKDVLMILKDSDVEDEEEGDVSGDDDNSNIMGSDVHPEIVLPSTKSGLSMSSQPSLQPPQQLQTSGQSQLSQSTQASSQLQQQASGQQPVPGARAPQTSRASTSSSSNKPKGMPSGSPSQGKNLPPLDTSTPQHASLGSKRSSGSGSVISPTNSVTTGGAPGQTPHSSSNGAAVTPQPPDTLAIPAAQTTTAADAKERRAQREPLLQQAFAEASRKVALSASSAYEETSAGDLDFSLQITPRIDELRRRGYGNVDVAGLDDDVVEQEGVPPERVRGCQQEEKAQSRKSLEGTEQTSERHELNLTTESTAADGLSWVALAELEMQNRDASKPASILPVHGYKWSTPPTLETAANYWTSPASCGLMTAANRRRKTAAAYAAANSTSTSASAPWLQFAQPCGYIDDAQADILPLITAAGFANWACAYAFADALDELKRLAKEALASQAAFTKYFDSEQSASSSDSIFEKLRIATSVLVHSSEPASYLSKSPFASLMLETYRLDVFMTNKEQSNTKDASQSPSASPLAAAGNTTARDNMKPSASSVHGNQAQPPQSSPTTGPTNGRSSGINSDPLLLEETNLQIAASAAVSNGFELHLDPEFIVSQIRSVLPSASHPAAITPSFGAGPTLNALSYDPELVGGKGSEFGGLSELAEASEEFGAGGSLKHGSGGAQTARGVVGEKERRMHSERASLDAVGGLLRLRLVWRILSLRKERRYLASTQDVFNVLAMAEGSRIATKSLSGTVAAHLPLDLLQETDAALVRAASKGYHTLSNHHPEVATDAESESVKASTTATALSSPTPGGQILWSWQSAVAPLRPGFETKGHALGPAMKELTTPTQDDQVLLDRRRIPYVPGYAPGDPGQILNNLPMHNTPGLALKTLSAMSHVLPTWVKPSNAGSDQVRVLESSDAQFASSDPRVIGQALAERDIDDRIEAATWLAGRQQAEKAVLEDQSLASSIFII